ncbi:MULTISPECIES: hypothetical protein [Calothrix]|uniref:Uncharacterized protein n=3 Tax=Calothrix TaxID=1186 RepID=A0ABR8A950_9CYAN|nr:hypothetical protein [Calothrix parietina]MBD2196408.1 hypothetical protein [Calothrix parietina FACHB-288]MBD2225196.1 hypothetical protein [Calothrix anomala FACHB-343]
MSNIVIQKIMTVVVFSFVNILILPTDVKAQDLTAACKGAIANAKTSLQKVPNVLIQDIYQKKNSENYSDSAAERPIEYIFHLTGTVRNGRMVETGIKQLGNSPKFLKSISQNIISQCNSIGAVSFGSTLAPGCGITFGLMGDGTVKEFENVDAPALGRPLKWGETFCS